MSTNSRIAKLEAAVPKKTDPIHISQFIVAPDKPVMGYSCEGIEIWRLPNEGDKSFRERCSAAVEWPDFTSIKIFDIID